MTAAELIAAEAELEALSRAIAALGFRIAAARAVAERDAVSLVDGEMRHMLRQASGGK